MIEHDHAVRAHIDMVYGTCRRVLGNDQDAADATQEVFLKWLARQDSVRGHLAGWLHATAHGTAVDHLRRRMAQRRVDAEAALRRADVKEPGEAMQAHLDEALASLPEAARALLVDHHLTGIGQAELAGRWRLSQAAISRRLAQARGLLAVALAKRGVQVPVAALVGSWSLPPVACPAQLTASLLARIPVGRIALIKGGAGMPWWHVGWAKVAIGAAALLLIAVPTALLGFLPAHLPPPAPQPGAAAVATDPPPPPRTPAQDLGLRKLMERGIALGFPDSAGARIFRGKLLVSSGATGATTATDSFAGVHAQLADGRWLVNLYYPLQPSATVRVSTDALDPMPEDSWGTTFMWTDFAYRLYVQGSMGIPIATLFRASAGQDEDVFVRAIDIHDPMRGSKYGPECWAEPSQLGGMPSYPYVVNRRKVAVDPQTVLRYALSRWFVLNLEDIHPPFVALPREVAIAGAKAMLPDDDSSSRTEIDRLAAVEPAPAPATSDAVAPVAARLITWRTRTEHTAPIFIIETVQRGSNEGETDANRFSDADLPALMALLGDPGPSRWMDCYRPRTIGDQALRAISTILRFDPRWLIARDVDAVWSDHERAAVATDLTAWWKDNQQATPAQIRSAVISRMDPPAILELITAAPPAERPQLYGQLPQMWPDRAPAGFDDYTYALLTMFDVPAMVAMAKRWPLTGDSRAMLAYWYFQHGDPAPLTACLEDALTQTATPQTRAPTYVDALFLLSVKPDLATVRLFQHVLAGDLASQPTKAMVAGCLGSFMGEDPSYNGIHYSEPCWRKLDDDAELHRTLHLAFVAQLMQDRHPLPADLLAMAGPSASPSLRISDLGAAHVGTLCYSFFTTYSKGRDPTSQVSRTLGLPLEQRDEYIDAMNDFLREILPDQLQKFHLDVAVPGFDPVRRGMGADGF